MNFNSQSFYSFSYFLVSNNSVFLIDASTNHDDGKKVYLIEYGRDNRPAAVDSTEVFEGKFKFTDSHGHTTDLKEVVPCAYRRNTESVRTVCGV